MHVCVCVYCVCYERVCVCVRCMVDGLLGKGEESSSLSCLDIVALDLGIHPYTDHKHVVARREADICGSTCGYVGE